jgi:hypothetical protein
MCEVPSPRQPSASRLATGMEPAVLELLCTRSTGRAAPLQLQLAPGTPASHAAPHSPRGVFPAVCRRGQRPRRAGYRWLCRAGSLYTASCEVSARAARHASPTVELGRRLLWLAVHPDGRDGSWGLDLAGSRPQSEQLWRRPLRRRHARPPRREVTRQRIRPAVLACKVVAGEPVNSISPTAWVGAVVAWSVRVARAESSVVRSGR